MNENRNQLRPAPIGLLACVVLLLLGAIALTLRSVFDDPAAIVRIEVQPAAVTLSGRDPRHGTLVTGWRADGLQVDLTAQTKFYSHAPAVVTAGPDGTLTALADGDALVTAQVGKAVAEQRVTVREMAKPGLISFRDDVLPVLTKAGCNAGGCHGKLAGQNGFRLSLRAFAPEWDYGWLTSEVRSRRVDYAFPDESLVIRKALGRTPHEGGRRFLEGSRSHEALLRWIEQRAPGPAKAEPALTGLEVLPGDRKLEPGQSQRLLVRARYEDGRERDVTWLAQFFSNDPATASVSPEGDVKSLRPGETSIRVHFQTQVAVVRFTTPYHNTLPAQEQENEKNEIDRHVFAKLRTLQIPASPAADDLTFLRRASLDATGSLPPPEAVQPFVGDPAPDKRARLVDQLLGSDAFTDYWTLQLADLLQNRKERDHDVRGTKGVRAFHGWLRQELAANKHWDQIARDLLLATGDSVAAPQVGYFITTVGEKNHVEESEVTDSVAQAFLGTRVGCARCHNHPLERYTQDDYYHFAAFFAKVSLERQDPMQGNTELLVASPEQHDVQKNIKRLRTEIKEIEARAAAAKDDQKKDEEKRLADKTRELAEREKDLGRLQNAAAEVMQPRTRQKLTARPLDRAPLALAGLDDPRQAFVQWLTSPQNEAFSGAMVNRIWKHFLGVGLVEPVDDLRASNPPSNAELWKHLNAAFVASGYDLRALMRLIMNSRAYQLSSETLPGNEPDRKFYSHYYARRLPAEVMLDAISAATQAPDTFEGYPVGTRAIQLPEPHVNNYFLGLFGRSDRVTACACERQGEVTLPQLLNLENGNELSAKLKAEDGRLQRLLAEPNGRVTEELFLCTLGREPRLPERTAVEAALKTGSKADVYSDLFWALLNSKDFVFNH